MDPASPEEIDHIVDELLADEGPPLLVRMDDGRTLVAGRTQPRPNRWAARSNNPPPTYDDPAEIRRRLEAEERWAENRRQVERFIGKPMRDNEAVHRLAGDVFHPGEERSTLLESINRALKDWNSAARKEVADEAIRKAVHGE
jgi:hypothetical protein